MKTSFCSDNTRNLGEEPIGTATTCQTYILVECPTPWASEAFTSKWVPENLRVLVEEVKRSRQPIKFLLITNNESHKTDEKTLLIYQQQEGLSSGYDKREFRLENIEQAATVIRRWLRGRNPGYEVETNNSRDILVCTHGSHDMCCSRYGSPFYFHAAGTIADLGFTDVRIWKSSHFGGHRFAPTAIDLPSGRYYGNLTQDVFQSILTRTGDVNCLDKSYRGWGILPSQMQILERELIYRYGWEWFDYKVAGRIIEQTEDKSIVRCELTLEKPDGSLYNYQARILKNDEKSVELPSSCNAKQNSMFVKYTVASLWLTSTKFITHSA
ncbi:sucrase ferredoxin [Calothrix sp. 336/3]|uniref:sucrase ferredoxin n=1 Tax=Calothrix sp. 336/3 TaxID=1337936 RepID=UPI0004E2D972|nr:sucrase ferredoxin [Calothrix sp. 336/3]AKG21734.1 sucrase ferredoxin [Calothrix sp. 336/3]